VVVRVVEVAGVGQLMSLDYVRSADFLLTGGRRVAHGTTCRQDGHMTWEWVAPVVTGAVGIVGVVGTVWTANQGRKAQSDILAAQGKAEFERSLIAEKRVLYSKFLRAIEQSIDVSDRIFPSGGHSSASEPGEEANRENVAGSPRGDLDAELQAMRDSNSDLAALRAEIAVLGGLRIGVLASKVNSLAFQYRGGDASRLNEAIGFLTYAMHADISLDGPSQEEIIKPFLQKLDKYDAGATDP
jgi:hypothetical protein